MLNKLIRVDPPLYTGATAVYPLKPLIAKKYVITSRFGDEMPLHSIDEKNGLMHLPRGLCPVGPDDRRDPGRVINYPKAPTPKPKQIKLFGKITEIVKEELSGVIVAPTGFGKTVLGFHAASEYGRRTLVITTKSDIMDQWIEGATKFLGVHPNRVGIIQSDKCEVLETDFVVGLIQSLSKADKYPDWIVKGFGMVLIDEVHRMPAEQFQHVASMFPAKMRLGLSATPERADGKEHFIFAHLGPIRAKETSQQLIPKVYRHHSGWQCPRTLKEDPETGKKSVQRIPHAPGKSAHVEKILAADPARLHLVASLAHTAWEQGRKVVIFSTMIRHLEDLMSVCTKTFKISKKEMGLYTQAKTKAEKAAREKIKLKPLIFTTYGMMSEGTDIPWLDCCILAMPRANVTQPVGRVRREHPDKKQPVVLDIVDDDSPVFSGYSAKRVRWYKSLPAEIETI